MDFVLGLHSHLPYVLNHGRWPHGSDWISEAAVDTYLPLIDSLTALADEDIAAPVTLGITPILANQLASPVFEAELRQFLNQRLEACNEAESAMRNTYDAHLIPVVQFWRERFTRLLELYDALDADIIGAFSRLQDDGRLELITSAATHGFLPLLQRDESIRFQLTVGQDEHERLFGSRAAGLWMPECAYRPAGAWQPLPSARAYRHRAGLEAHLVEHDVRFVFVDAHLAQAGLPLGVYGELPTTPHEMIQVQRRVRASQMPRSPYRPYWIGSHGKKIAPRALIRDPRSSMQLWSRHGGYPGDGAYLEFHKIRYPGGLKLWRVTSDSAGLGDKLAYEPDYANEQVLRHAKHFARLLSRVGDTIQRSGAELIAVPFDTELFGHWWFEGVDFVEELYRQIDLQGGVRPLTASAHLNNARADVALNLSAGSWGKDGDWSMWLNAETNWTWEKLWPLEEEFWRLAPAAIENTVLHPVLAQAARQLLLAQSSDWQFIITTGEAADYAEARIKLHISDCARLMRGLDGSKGDLANAKELAKELEVRDAVFPNILDSLRACLSR
ncbi:MAG TPA: 1,4-alpha-glucan branching protein domain-containing protein [Gemmatimonadaceae bacterium]|nr:1,4-alpha-glucan branching protein domain-containing protein [Gemmatimonadaceae bacterium]